MEKEVQEILKILELRDFRGTAYAFSWQLVASQMTRTIEFYQIMSLCWDWKAITKDDQALLPVGSLGADYPLRVFTPNEESRGWLSTMNLPCRFTHT